MKLTSLKKWICYASRCSRLYDTSLSLSVSVYVPHMCEYIYTHIYRCVCTYTHLSEEVDLLRKQVRILHTHTYICVYVYIYIYIYIHTHTCICIYVYICTHVCVCVRTPTSLKRWTCYASRCTLLHDILHIHTYIGLTRVFHLF